MHLDIDSEEAAAGPGIKDGEEKRKAPKQAHYKLVRFEVFAQKRPPFNEISVSIQKRRPRNQKTENNSLQI